jgi:hypothetical protein
LSQSAVGLSRHEELPDRFEARADAADGRRSLGVPRHGQRQLLRPAPRLGQQPLLRALQGQPLVVQQGLDPEDQVEIAPPVQPLPGRILLGAEQLELGLPVPQDVRRYSRCRLGLAYSVIELVG